MKLIKKLKLRSLRPSIKNGFERANANYDAGFYKRRGLPLFNYSEEIGSISSFSFVETNIMTKNHKKYLEQNAKQRKTHWI